MGDRLATKDMGRKEGAALPLPGEASWVPVLAEAYLCTKWHLDPSSRLATTDRPKIGGCGSLSNTMSPGSRSTSIPS